MGRVSYTKRNGRKKVGRSGTMLSLGSGTLSQEISRDSGAPGHRMFTVKQRGLLEKEEGSCLHKMYQRNSGKVISQEERLLKPWRGNGAVTCKRGGLPAQGGERRL